MKNILFIEATIKLIYFLILFFFTLDRYDDFITNYHFIINLLTNNFIITFKINK